MRMDQQYDTYILQAWCSIMQNDLAVMCHEVSIFVKQTQGTAPGICQQVVSISDPRSSHISPYIFYLSNEIIMHIQYIGESYINFHCHWTDIYTVEL